MSRKIREAKLSDMAEILKVMDAAKKIMRQSGNMLQWGEGYPSEKVIAADMEKDGGFVIEEEDRIIAYFAFLPSPEPTYKVIYEGEWMDDELPYHVQRHHGFLLLSREEHPHRHSSRQQYHAAQHRETWFCLLRHHPPCEWRRAVGLPENNRVVTFSYPFP